MFKKQRNQSKYISLYDLIFFIFFILFCLYLLFKKTKHCFPHFLCIIGTALKKSYVDVFNPSGAPAKPIETAMMAPLLPSGPPGGFFIPGAVATGQPQEVIEY